MVHDDDTRPAETRDFTDEDILSEGNQSRPPPEIHNLIVKISSEHPDWKSGQIEEELYNVHKVREDALKPWWVQSVLAELRKAVDQRTR